MPARSLRRSVALLGRVYGFRRRLLRACPEDARFDLVLCHDDLPAIGSAALAARTRSRLALDLVEIHRLRERTGDAYRAAPRWVTRHLDRVHLSIIRRADVLFTIGVGLAQEITSDAHEPIVIRNARPYHARPKRTGVMRRELDLPDDALVIVSVGSISPGMGLEEVAAALPRLGDHAHLVHVGPVGRSAQIDLTKHGPADRVHFAPAQDWHELPQYLADADIGIVPWRPSPTAPTNLRLAFPNRVFDFIAARLPLVSYAVPDIAMLTRQYRLGEIVDQDVGETLALVAANIERYRPGLERAAREINASREMQRLITALPTAKRIAVVCMKNPAIHGRLRQIVRALTHSGMDVTVFSPWPPEPHPGVVWHSVGGR